MEARQQLCNENAYTTIFTVKNRGLKSKHTFTTARSYRSTISFRLFFPVGQPNNHPARKPITNVAIKTKTWEASAFQNKKVTETTRVFWVTKIKKDKMRITINTLFACFTHFPFLQRTFPFVHDRIVLFNPIRDDNHLVRIIRAQLPHNVYRSLLESLLDNCPCHANPVTTKTA